ncbi:MAG: hypothetical protein IKI69_04570 [Oscillospiraceae bacterium]|nr:hypothetical protein [Oscillospiraceae bacterium]
MTCFMIGHRYVPADLRLKLDEAIERYVTDYGVSEFVVGHYGQFDAMAAGAVRSAKKRHPGLKLTLLLLYYSGCPVRGPEDYDGTIYPEGMEFVPRRAAIVRANRYMVDNSDFLLCYDAALVGNRRIIVDEARRLEKRGRIRICNLA